MTNSSPLTIPLHPPDPFAHKPRSIVTPSLLHQVNLPPMAGLVNWDHSVQYNTPSLEDFGSSGGGSGQVSYSYKVDTADPSNPYTTMRDHVIDGRNLLPATGYLYLVWRSVATLHHSTVEKFPVVLQEIALHQVQRVCLFFQFYVARFFS